MALTSTANVTSSAQFVPEEIAADIVKDVRHSSAVMRLAKKVNQNTLQKTYNTRVSGPSGYWVDDLERKTADTASWDQINMFAHEIAVIVPVKERDFIGNPLDVWAEIREDIVEAFAITFDSAALFGTASPYNTDLLQQVAISSNFVVEGTGVDLADDISLTMGKTEAKNYAPNGFLSLMSIKSRLRGLRTEDDVPIFQTDLTQNSADRIYGLPTSFYVDANSWNENVTGFVADWNQVHYSIVQGISYKLLTEATLTTVTDGSGNPLSLAELDMVALRATMFAGFRPIKPEGIAALVTSDFASTPGTPATAVGTPEVN
jgi:HK97 family phage major capsid protein